MLTLDGSHGEGGGQILRAALSLAAATARPLRIVRVRAGRPRPGLQPQHLAVVRALAAVSGARVEGDALDSTALTFEPERISGGAHRIDIEAIRGSAGSTTLAYEALLLPLARAALPSTLTLTGGTHVPWSPPVQYLTDVFVPAVRELGLDTAVRLSRWGWYPAGGGRLEATVAPGLLQGASFAAERDTRITGLSAVSHLPRAIAERQRRRALERLRAAGLDADIDVLEDATSRGPGTLLMLAVRGRAGFSALGRRGVPAERVADEAVEPLLDWWASGTAVDDRLADQLLPFLALARSPSRFTCPRVSGHLATVAWVIRQLLEVRIELDAGPPARVDLFPGDGNDDRAVGAT
jgi:RNA 3'-terminal phosphate cyclase (ATP)